MYICFVFARICLLLFIDVCVIDLTCVVCFVFDVVVVVVMFDLRLLCSVLH